MEFANYDIYFPHIGVGIRNLHNSISIFGFKIAYYGIIIACGMIMGLLIASKDYKRHGGNPEDISDLAIFSIFFAILGARLYYVAFEWSYYKDHLLEIINLRRGGLAIYGGVIASTISCYVFTKRRKIKFHTIADSAVIGLILGQAIGRWGNFFNAEAFGGFTENFFAMRIKLSIVGSNMLNQEVISKAVNVGGCEYIQVHPTFLYESVWNLLVCIVLYFTSGKKKFDGQIFYEYLMLYGLGRFFIEGLRTDSLIIWGTGIAVSQLLSGVLFVFAAANLIRGFKKKS